MFIYHDPAKGHSRSVIASSFSPVDAWSPTPPRAFRSPPQSGVPRWCACSDGRPLGPDGQGHVLEGFAPSSFLLLVAMPFAPSSFLLLVAMPFAPSSFLLLVAMPFAPSSFLLLVAMPFAPSSFLLLVAMPFAPSCS